MSVSGTKAKQFRWERADLAGLANQNDAHKTGALSTTHGRICPDVITPMNTVWKHAPANEMAFDDDNAPSSVKIAPPFRLTSPNFCIHTPPMLGKGAKNQECSHNTTNRLTTTPTRTSNRNVMKNFLRLSPLSPATMLVMALFILSLAGTSTAFQVMDGPPTTGAKHYPNNKKNQQTFASLLPPLPISTTTTTTTGSKTTSSSWGVANRGPPPSKPLAPPVSSMAAGVNKSKADVRKYQPHPLWYDDHNPTARKVKYLDHHEYGSDGIRSFAFAEDWADDDSSSSSSSSLSSSSRRQRRPIASLWRRVKQWYSGSGPSSPLGAY